MLIFPFPPTKDYICKLSVVQISTSLIGPVEIPNAGANFSITDVDISDVMQNTSN